MKKRILLVEDEETIAAIIPRSLARRGYEVEVARTADEGFNCLIIRNLETGKRKIDLVICDIKLLPIANFANGLAMIKKVKTTLGPSMPPVIFWSGGLPADVTTEDLLAVGQKFFEKPVELKVLLAAVAELLELPAGG